MKRLSTSCAIAGGGPAGLMLGLLLARAGVSVAVLEKHTDFLRDFRGDTIHPSTLEVMHELGLGEALLSLPHQKVASLTTQFGGTALQLADFSHLPVRSPFIAMMPQWDFLDFLAGQGRRYPSFTLITCAEVTDLIETENGVRGVRAATSEGPLEITADLVIGADGRSSVLRAKAGLEVQDIGAPMDALWFRLSRKPADTEQTQGRFLPGRIFVMLNRGDYWQCAFVIPKGSLDGLKAAGLEAFRANVGALVPFEAERANGIASWDDVKLLNVKVDRLKRWAKPGLLFIGDAAHAMSPVGGVGINLAIQDAVAAANILAAPLREGRCTCRDLEAVQKRREFPARMTQRLQVIVQNNVISRALEERDKLEPPLLLKLIARTPWLRRIPARLVGLGVRPEHVAESIRIA
jgi:2-polyprenyl-6-methoxyphenol hydroxylase-like FAD-dependent oxidoreductase